MYDAIVIGLGGVGSYALRALAKAWRGKGKRILGIDRYQRNHNKGSSHGESRVFRRAYFEDEGYIPWIDFSIKEWEIMEQETGLSLLNKCGNLILQDKPCSDQTTSTTSTTIATTKDKKNYLQLAMNTAQKHDIEVEFLIQEQLQKRFPQFHYPHNHHDSDGGTATATELIGLLEPNACFVRPELAISAALSQAEQQQQQQGEDFVTIWENTQVVSLQQLTENSVEVKVVRRRHRRRDHDVEDEEEDGDDEEEEEEYEEKFSIITGKTVLIAAGAWSSQLIPSWSQLMTVTRQCQGWVDVSQSTNPSMYMPDKFPTWILSTKRHHLPFFGIPVANNTTGNGAGQYIKVGVHNHIDNIEGDPSYNSTEPISQTELEEYQRAVKVAIDSTAWNNKNTNDNNKDNNMGGQGGTADDEDGGRRHYYYDVPSSQQLRIQPCMYTMTPDENFLMGIPKEYQSVYAIAGLSGHGFKMAPALGSILADFALLGGGEDELNAKWKPEFCNPNRFLRTEK